MGCSCAGSDPACGYGCGSDVRACSCSGHVGALEAWPPWGRGHGTVTTALVAGSAPEVEEAGGVREGVDSQLEPAAEPSSRFPPHPPGYPDRMSQDVISELSRVLESVSGFAGRGFINDDVAMNPLRCSLKRGAEETAHQLVLRVRAEAQRMGGSGNGRASEPEAGRSEIPSYIGGLVDTAPLGSVPSGPPIASPAASSANPLTLAQGCLEGRKDVASWDVASLADRCKLNLGKCKALGTLWDGEISAQLPREFAATSSHGDYLSWALSDWWEALDGSDSAVWDIVGKPIQWGLDWDAPELQAFGLYWTSGEGFLYYALRYAVATMYAFPGMLNKPDVFGNACLVSKAEIIEAIEKRLWTLTVTRKCDFSKDRIVVAWNGEVAAERAWQGSYIGLTLLLPTCINDGIMVNAALADYFFSWGIRLFDYVNAGLSDDPMRDKFTSLLCARAALSEIVDIVGLFVHEHSHSTGFPATEWECGAFGRPQECCHFQLGWSSRARLMSRLALPLPRLPDVAESSSAVFLDRFDFDWDEHVSFTFAFSGSTWLGGPGSYDCSGSSMVFDRVSIWDAKAGTTLSWSYPSATNGEWCTQHEAWDSAAFPQTGQEDFNGGA